MGVLNRVETLVTKHVEGVSMAPFGSFASGVHIRGSDIDISLEVAPGSKFAYQPEPPHPEGHKPSRRERDKEKVSAAAATLPPPPSCTPQRAARRRGAPPP